MSTNPDDNHADEDIEELRARLREAEDTLEAIREGAVDALVVKSKDQQQIFTLRSADHTYRVLIESMNQGALTITEEGVILYSNKQFSRLVNRPLQQIIGSRIQAFFKPEHQVLITAIIKHNRRKGTAKELTLEIAGPSYKALMLSVTRLRQEPDNEAYMCIVVTDMTARKQAEDAKDEFISLASHQLRTPATGVKQYLGMLLEGYAGDLTEEHRMFIKTAYDSNERQLSIISDILKTARIDSGVYTLQRTRENVLKLVKDVLTDYKSIFAMRNQKVVCLVPTELFIHVDPVEISLVLSNLIENASKYSPEGKIITVKAASRGKHVYISVIDQGVGIAEIDQTRIFDKFTRIDNDLSDTVNGNGLGLYWVKQIVKMHDGTIEVGSQLHKGTTFTVGLPA
jgi:PAS domain S-box-containing protein